jgi:hypothetical protein
VDIDEELSPIAMVGFSLGCGLVPAMGTLAARDNPDILGAMVDVEVSLTNG